MAAEQKAEADRLAAEHARQEAEQKALLAASKIKNAAKREAFEAEQAHLQKLAAAEAARKQQEAVEAANLAEQKVQDAIRAPESTAEKARGQATRKTLGYRVVDAKLVYAMHPELCTLEVKASAVKATCSAREGCTEYEPDTQSMPGLELWWNTELTYRSK
jgi:membrane protein involved in colicin uptake